MDLHTNATQGLTRENSLVLEPGDVPDDAIVKIAQTFRSGTSDADAIDYVEMALDDEAQTRLEDLNDVYVLVNFRPAVTNENWRIDCGVAGFDNTFGLPPFFPTRLRFEDYIYRLWVQQRGVVSAHVDAAQTHIKSNYMRNPLAMELFNEEICNLLKSKIRSSLTRIDELCIDFDYAGEVTLEDSERILERIVALHARVLATADRAVESGAGDRAAQLRPHPGEELLRLRARLLPAERDPHRGRRDQPVQRLARDLAERWSRSSICRRRRAGCHCSGSPIRGVLPPASRPDAAQRRGECPPAGAAARRAPAAPADCKAASCRAQRGAGGARCENAGARRGSWHGLCSALRHGLHQPRHRARFLRPLVGPDRLL